MEELQKLIDELIFKVEGDLGYAGAIQKIKDFFLKFEEGADCEQWHDWPGLKPKTFLDVGDEVIIQLGYPYNCVTVAKFYDDRFYRGVTFSRDNDWTDHVVCWKNLPKSKVMENE